MAIGPQIKFIVDRDDGDADRLAQGLVDAFKQQLATIAASANLDCVPHAELDRFAGLLDTLDNVGHVGLLSALVPARPKHAGTMQAMQATLTDVVSRARAAVPCHGISDHEIIAMLAGAARECMCAIDRIRLQRVGLVITGTGAGNRVEFDVVCSCGALPRTVVGVHNAPEGLDVVELVRPTEWNAQPDARVRSEYKREVLGEWVAAQPKPFEARDRPHPAAPRDGESGWGGPVTRGDVPPATWCDLTPSWYGRGRTYVEIARGIFDRLATIRPGPHILAVDVQPDRVLFLLPDRMSREMRNRIRDTLAFEGRPAPGPTDGRRWKVLEEAQAEVAALVAERAADRRERDALRDELDAARAKAPQDPVPGLSTWKAWATVRDTDGTSRAALAWTILHLSCSTEAEHLAAELATIVADYRRDQERERAAYGKVFLYDEDAEDRVFSCDWSAEVKRKLRENAATAGPRVYVQGEDD